MCHGYKSIALCNMSPKGLLCRTYLQTAFAFSKLNPDRLFLLLFWHILHGYAPSCCVSPPSDFKRASGHNHCHILMVMKCCMKPSLKTSYSLFLHSRRQFSLSALSAAIISECVLSCLQARPWKTFLHGLT